MLRSVLYTSDLALWATVAMLAAIGYEVVQTGWVGTGRWRGWSLLTNSVLLIVGFTLLL